MRPSSSLQAYMAWKYVGFQAGRPKVGLGGMGAAIAAPPSIPTSQMKMQFVPASHVQNTLICTF